MIKQQKSDYTSPTSSILELRSEGLICQSVAGSTINPITYDDDPFVL